MNQPVLLVQAPVLLMFKGIHKVIHLQPLHTKTVACAQESWRCITSCAIVLMFMLQAFQFRQTCTVF